LRGPLTPALKQSVSAALQMPILTSGSVPGSFLSKNRGLPGSLDACLPRPRLNVRRKGLAQNNGYQNWLPSPTEKVPETGPFLFGRYLRIWYN